MADRSKLNDYIAELEAAAYARGKADARAEMQTALEESVKELQARVLAMQEQLVAEFAPLYRRASSGEQITEAEPREPREGSDQAKVLDVIREHPGLRGMEVVKALHGSVEERTVRTALHRLKKRNAIMQREGGAWHPVPMSLFQSNEGQPSA